MSDDLVEEVGRDVASRLATATDSIRHESHWLMDQAKRVSGEMDSAWPIMREARERIRALESELAAAKQSVELIVAREREPTEAMIKAGASYIANMVGDPYNSWSHFTNEATSIWKAMSDAKCAAIRSNTE